MMQDPFSNTDDASPGGSYATWITVVCTGNICRSPVAAASLSQSYLGRVARIQSAGLSAVQGAPVDADASRAAEELSVKVDERHKGVQIDDAMVNSSLLILTMTRRQRQQLVKWHPRALQKIFTLVEFRKLLELESIERDAALRAKSLEALARDMVRLRGRITHDRSLDIDDPFRQALGVHREVVSKIVDEVSSIATLVREAVHLDETDRT